MPSGALPAPLGAGITIRRSFLAALHERVRNGDPALREKVRWFEAVPENYIGRGGFARRALLEIAEEFPLALHGVSLSIGSVDPLNEAYLRALGSLVRDTRARWVSDHLCFSSVAGVQFHNLLPLPFSREAVRHVVRRIRAVQAFLGVPFGIENPSYYVQMPGSEMTEAQFLGEVVEASGCFLLLDINNVYVNSMNHTPGAFEEPELGFAAALEFLRRIPLSRVQEVHIAGHERLSFRGRPLILDTHGAAVTSRVRDLLAELHRLQPVRTLLLEREANLPPLDDVLAEAQSLWSLVSCDAPRRGRAPVHAVGAVI